MRYQTIVFGITLTLMALNSFSEDYSINLSANPAINLSKIQVSESDGAAVGMFLTTLYIYNQPTPYNNKTGYFSISYTDVSHGIPITYTRSFSLSPEKILDNYIPWSLSVLGGNTEFPLCVQTTAGAHYSTCKLNVPNNNGDSGCPAMLLSLPTIEDGIAFCQNVGASDGESVR